MNVRFTRDKYNPYWSIEDPLTQVASPLETREETNVSGRGVKFYSADTNTFEINNSHVVINELSKDVNFRVEGNGDANLLFTDGGNDRVGIGTNSPSYKLEVNQDANVGGLKVTGGGGGVAIARFQRDVGGTAYVDIHCNSDDPQITFTDSGASRQYSIGADSSFNGFKISENSSIGTNDRLSIDDSGNVGI